MKLLKPNSSALLILGMHRSGTSALTRVLNLLGVDIGSQFIPANQANEKGFWELIAVARGNEEILQSLHSSWFNPLLLPQQWWQSPLLFWWRRYLTKIIQQNFSDSLFWGIKDPRLCRLLPLWLPLIEELGSKIHGVIIMRNPEEVVASLQSRDQLPRHLSLWLWLTYVLEAEYDTRTHPRVFITYQELLENWQQTIEKIASALKLTWPNFIDSVQAEIDEFLTTALKHHNTRSILEDLEGDELTQWSHQVYQIMTQLSQNNDQSLGLLTTIRQNLNDYSQQHKINLNSVYQNQETIYQKWLKKHSSVHINLPKNQELSLHILVRCSQKQKYFLKNTIEALFSQTYSYWYLSIMAPFSSQETEYWNEPRLRWIQVDTTLSIPTIIHREIERVSADWVSLINVGDSFNPEFLSIIVHYIHIYPKWRFIYVDEDNLSINGNRYAPQFKPDFNLDLLRSTSFLLDSTTNITNH